MGAACRGTLEVARRCACVNNVSYSSCWRQGRWNRSLGQSKHGKGAVISTPQRIPKASFSSSSSSSTTNDGFPSSLSEKVSKRFKLPLFVVPSAHVELLERPSEFYAQLLGIISRARRRIYLASLYIGKGEVDLIRHLGSALENNADLRLTVLVDQLRSTREGAYTFTPETESCASLLAGLQAKFPGQVEVRAFRASGLPAWLERLIGKRFVEGYGLQHMKLYGNEDEIMVSGANLSNDYFTNRRDRYVSIRDRQLSQYAFEVLATSGRFSYSLQADPAASSATQGQENDWHRPYKLVWDDGKGLSASVQANHQATGPKDWRGKFTQEVNAFTERWYETSSKSMTTVADHAEETVRIVPMLQMGPMNIRHETSTIPLLLEAANALDDSRLDFTTGYFSLNPLYARWIVQGRFKSTMITAAPQANGFYQSKGVSRHLPAAYTWLEHRFWRTLVANNRQMSVSIFEWLKPGWTYHAKGIWIYPPKSPRPVLSLLGSSNFGIRSAKLDLECTLVIDASQSAQMRQRLEQEVSELRRDATDQVGQTMFERAERRVHWGVKVAAWCIQRML